MVAGLGLATAQLMGALMSGMGSLFKSGSRGSSKIFKPPIKSSPVGSKLAKKMFEGCLGLRGRKLGIVSQMAQQNKLGFDSKGRRKSQTKRLISELGGDIYSA